MFVAGEVEGEGGSGAGFTVDFEFAAVIADDALDDHEAEAGAFLFGGVVGLENASEIFGGDSGSGVLEGYGDEAFGGGEGDFEESAGGHDLHGVADEVKEGLLDLVFVEEGGGEGFGGVDFDEDVAVEEFLFEEAEGVVEDIVEGGAFESGLGGSEGFEELIDDEVEAFDFALGDVEEFGEGFAVEGFAVIEFAAEELKVDGEGVEGVSDFVGDASGEQGNGIKAFGFEDAGFVDAFSGDVAKDDDSALLGGIYGGEGDDVEVDVAAFGVLNFDFAIDEFGPFAFVEVHDEVPLDVFKVAANGVSFGFLAGESEHFFGGAVGVGDASLSVEDDEAFLNGMEDGFEEALFTGEAEEVGLKASCIEFVDAGDEFFKEG